MHLIQASGFPWLATKLEIALYFKDINILNGPNGIHFTIGAEKNSKNEAIIQLATSNDHRLAVTRKYRPMGTAPIRCKFNFI